jgi:hypothetical protein
MGAMRRVLLFSVALAFTACGSSIVIHKTNLGERSTPKAGTELELKRVPIEGKVRPRPGYTTIRGPDGWADAFGGKGAPPPPTVDWTKQTVLLAVPDDPKTDTIAIDHAVVAGPRSILHVYVGESAGGEGCTKKEPGAPTADAVIIDRVPEEVHFWVDHLAAARCGAKPTAKLSCKVEGGSEGTKIAATPGQKVTCDSSASTAGAAGSVTDRAWSLGQLPPGSIAQLTTAPGGATTSFTVDAFGTYNIKVQVSDSEARGDEAAAVVDVQPPKDGIVLQMGWTHFKLADQAAGFARVQLQGVEMPAPFGTMGKSCAADIQKKPAWCAEISKFGAVTQLKLAAQEKKQYKFGVKYVEEREGEAIVCLRVFVLGAKGTEVCDDHPRKANDVWDAGVLDLGTMEFVAAPAKPAGK